MITPIKVLDQASPRNETLIQSHGPKPTSSRQSYIAGKTATKKKQGSSISTSGNNWSGLAGQHSKTGAYQGRGGFHQNKG